MSTSSTRASNTLVDVDDIDTTNDAYLLASPSSPSSVASKKRVGGARSIPSITVPPLSSPGGVSSSASASVYGGSSSVLTGGAVISASAYRKAKEENSVLTLQLANAMSDIKKLQSSARDKQMEITSFAEQARAEADAAVARMSRACDEARRRAGEAERKLSYLEQNLQATTIQRDAAMEEARSLRQQVLQAKVSGLSGNSSSIGNGGKNHTASNSNGTSFSPHEMAVALLERWTALGEAAEKKRQQNPSLDMSIVVEDTSSSSVSDHGFLLSPLRIKSSSSSFSANSASTQSATAFSSYTSSSPAVAALSPSSYRGIGDQQQQAAAVKPVQVARLVAKWNTSTNAVSSSSSSASTTASSPKSTRLPGTPPPSPFGVNNTNNSSASISSSSASFLRRTLSPRPAEAAAAAAAAASSTSAVTHQAAGTFLNRRGEEAALRAKIGVLLNEVEDSKQKGGNLLKHLTGVIQDATKLEVALIEEKKQREIATQSAERADAVAEQLERQTALLRARLQTAEEQAAAAIEKVTSLEESRGIDKLQAEIARLRGELARKCEDEYSVAASATTTSTSTPATSNSTHVNKAIKQDEEQPPQLIASPTISANVTPTKSSSPAAKSHADAQVIAGLTASSLLLQKTQEQQQKRIHELLQELHALQQKQAQDSLHTKMLTSNFDTVTSELNAERSINAQLQAIIADLTLKYQDAKAQLARAHVRLEDILVEAAKSEMAAEGQRDDEAAAIVAAAAAQRNSLLTELNRAIQSKEEELQSLRETLSVLQSRMDEATALGAVRHATLVSRAEGAETALVEIRSKFTSVQMELTKRNASVVEKTSRIAVLSEQIRDFQQQIADLQLLLNGTKEALAKVSAEKEIATTVASKNLSSVQEALADTKKELDVRNELVRKMQEALADSADRVPRLQETILKLKEQRTADRAKLKEETEVIIQLRKELSAFTEADNLKVEVDAVIDALKGGVSGTGSGATVFASGSRGNAPPASRVIEISR